MHRNERVSQGKVLRAGEIDLMRWWQQPCLCKPQLGSGYLRAYCKAGSWPSHRLLYAPTHCGVCICPHLSHLAPCLSRICRLAGLLSIRLLRIMPCLWSSRWQALWEDTSQNILRWVHSYWICCCFHHSHLASLDNAPSRISGWWIWGYRYT